MNMNTLFDKFNEHIKKYGKAVEINGVDAIGFFKEIDEKQSTDLKYLFVEKGLLKQGDIINSISNTWIVTNEPICINDVYDKALVQRCNYNVKFMFEDGIVKELPSIIDSKVFDSETGKYIPVAMGKIIVMLQNNSISMNINVNSRFIKMGSAFKVVGKDLTRNGLTILYCDLDMIGSQDDTVNEIANAYDYIYTISITNGETANISNGNTLQLITELQLNAVVVTNKSIAYTSSNTDIATIDSNGLVTTSAAGECIISAYMVEMPNIVDTINITVQDVVLDNFTYGLVGSSQPDTEIKSNITKTYTAVTVQMCPF